MKKCAIYFSLLFTILLLSFASCDEDNEKNKGSDDFIEKENQRTVLTLYVPDYPNKLQVQPELEKVCEEIYIRTAGTLNIELNVKTIPYYSLDPGKNLKNLFDTDNELDFLVATGGLNTLIANDCILDLSKLLPEYAPGLYSQYSNEELLQVTYGGKVMAIPTLSRGSQRVCAVVREDLLQKYDIERISTFEDYVKFLELIKENEKGISPAAVANMNTSIFMQKYGYVKLDGYLVYRWDDPDMKLLPWEKAPEYREAYKTIKRLIDNGYLNMQKFHPDHIAPSVKSGVIASFVSEWDEAIRITRAVSTDVKLKVFPLYTEMKAPKSPNTNAVIVINRNSRNADMVMRFLEWVQSDQRNYDLLMYGIHGTNYELEGKKVRLSKEHPFYGWGGSEAFENSIYAREFDRDPSGIGELNRKIVDEYSHFIPSAGFKPDLKGDVILAINRRGPYFDGDTSLNFSGVKPKDADEEIDAIMNQEKVFGADNFVAEMQKQLNEWKASR